MVKNSRKVAKEAKRDESVFVPENAGRDNLTSANNNSFISSKSAINPKNGGSIFHYNDNTIQKIVVLLIHYFICATAAGKGLRFSFKGKAHT